MAKALEQMTLEELWQLFPIALVPHNPQWKVWYRQQRDEILTYLPKEWKCSISHIGSTAVPDIWAKNIVDILLEIERPECLPELRDILHSHGWLCMSQCETRISMNLGYTPEGFAQKVFHLHLRQHGDHDELYFRDYLRNHPETAKEYQTLKLRLWKEYEHDRDSYTLAKSDFVRQYTALAKREFPNRYERMNIQR
jgi:GrpB-like predicted nucleotidyltransferase (UPF0157 family)